MRRALASLLLFALYANPLFAGAAGAKEVDTKKFKVDISTADGQAGTVPVTINIDNHPTFTNSPIFNNELFINVQSFIKNTTQAFASNESVQYALQQLNTIKEMQNWVTAHPYKSGFIVSALIYLSICIQLAHSYTKIESLQWANFKKDMSSDEFYEQCLTKNGKYALQQLLMQEIFTRYHHPQEPTNSVKAMVCFLRDIEQEISLIDRYIKISKSIQSARIAKIFPVSAQKLDIAQNKLRRVKLLKTIFIDWSAQYKLNQLALPSQAASSSESWVVDGDKIGGNT